MSLRAAWSVVIRASGVARMGFGMAQAFRAFGIPKRYLVVRCGRYGRLAHATDVVSLLAHS